MIKAVYRVSAVTEQALKITVLPSDLFRKEIKDPSSRFILTWWINRGPFPHECDTRTTKPVSTRLTHDQEQQKGTFGVRNSLSCAKDPVKKCGPFWMNDGDN